MTDKNLNTKKSENTTAAIAGVAGAVVGAGVAVAATKLMADKDMRDKVKTTLTNVKDQVMEALDTAAKDGSNSAKHIKEGIETGTQKKISQPSQANKSGQGSRSEMSASSMKSN